MHRFFGSFVAFLLTLLPSNSWSMDTSSVNHAATGVSFDRDVQPIFSRHCYGCHQPAKQLGQYLMTDFAAMVAGGETALPAIVPGDPSASYLIDQITRVDGHAEMPDEPFAPLSQVEIETISRWISEGAVDDSPTDTGPLYDADHPPTYQAAYAAASIDVSPDGNLVAVAGYHEVVLIDAATGDIRKRLIGISPRITTVRFSPDGSHVAVAGGTPAVRGELQVWEVATGQLSLSLPITFDEIYGASWSPDGTKIAFGATDNVVRAVDAVTGQQVLFQGAHEDWVLDTAFTPTGSHVISVARDMSCKLTEVATERFIDNVTSITPGALSGGLTSIDVHPTRNEMIVGGADGIAKVYRLFRETERKIGDDANLIRALPKMPGRIFSVAISPDATRLAAASTLNGRSEVRVWKYDFSGGLSKPLKAILGKRVSDRSPAETAQLQAYQAAEVTLVSRVTIDHAVYALSLASDNSVWIAGGDGIVRRIDDAGKEQLAVAVCMPVTQTQVATNASGAIVGFDAKTYQDLSVPAAQPTTQIADVLPADVVSLSVSPSEIKFTSPYDYSQIVVTAVDANGNTADVTRLCQYDASELVTLTCSGLLRPVDDGTSRLTIRYGQTSTVVSVRASGIVASGSTEHGAVDFLRDVTPVLSRLGCNQGTCHGAQKGKNGFRLSLRGYDPVFDLRALTDDLAARRINPAAPQESLMLRKPLGITPHQGGTLIAEGDPNHAILGRWIADGSQLDMTSSRVSHIEVFPSNPIVQSVDAHQQVRVVAHYDDGTNRDVTRDAFIESGNTDVATSDKTGWLSAVRRGEAPILARYEGAYAATTLTVMGLRDGYDDAQVSVDAFNRIDELVAKKWQRVKVVPSDLCDDATFLRRVYLDLTGLPPTSDEVREFLADDTDTRVKRSSVVDRLIGSEAYVEYWTNKWADLLLVNRKFLGVEGSEAFRKWIRQSIATNKPYDEFAREILTAAGSNKDNPPASYFKTLRTPEDIMENTTHLFLGIRFNCNKCHDHPFERWTQDQYYEMTSFFAQVGLERDPASGKKNIGGTAVEGAKPLYERVVDRDTGDTMHPTTGGPVEPDFPFEVPHAEDADATRRARLAAWISDADNPYFARSYVNRLWGYLLGVGLIEPIDDLRAGNPPTNPELLDHLTDTFVQSHFDVAEMLRTICNSRTYQLSIETMPLNRDDRLNYSHALPRRLPAEVIYDAVHQLTGSISNIPGAPAGTRAAALSDSGIRLDDGFLQNLGRPARESVCECERSSELQLGPVMALISGPTIGGAISDPKNELERLVADHADDKTLVEELFLRALGRLPTSTEFEAFNLIATTMRQDHERLSETLAAAEIAWKERREVLEEQRLQRVAEIASQIESHTLAIQPERDRLNAERIERIAAAKEKLAEVNANLDAKVTAWATKHPDPVEWHPLAMHDLSSTNKAALTPLDDRSILVSEDTSAGTYTVRGTTNLNAITGIRLEVLPDESLPMNGPGWGANGNFVLTELEVSTAPAGDPKNETERRIASGIADFLQFGFKIEQAFDRAERNQAGWAVSGATGVVHWATFKLDEPRVTDGPTTWIFKLHQYHNAKDHRIGRFRISVTTDKGDIMLGRPESLAAILNTPPGKRTDAAKKTIDGYVRKTNAEITAAQDALAQASKPVPPNERLVELENLHKALSVQTPDDPALVQLRLDHQQSEIQLKNKRLTAAEDLIWALVNSPAFLFNR